MPTRTYIGNARGVNRSMPTGQGPYRPRDHGNTPLTLVKVRDDEVEKQKAIEPKLPPVPVPEMRYEPLTVGDGKMKKEVLDSSGKPFMVNHENRCILCPNHQPFDWECTLVSGEVDPGTECTDLKALARFPRIKRYKIVHIRTKKADPNAERHQPLSLGKARKLESLSKTASVA